MGLGDSIHHRVRFSATVTPLRLLLAIVFSGNLLSGQTNSVKCVFEGDPSRNAMLRSLDLNNLVYVSLGDVASRLSLRSVTDKSLQRFTVYFPGTQLHFFPDNPFVAIQRAGQPNNAVQLPTDVIMMKDELYLALASSAPLFQQLFETVALFDRASATLLIKDAPKKPAFDITDVTFDPKVNGMLIRLEATRKLSQAAKLLKKEDAWLYITLPGAKVDIARLNKTKPDGFVKKVLATQFKTSAQIAFKFDQDKVASCDFVPNDSTYDVVVAVHGSGEFSAPAPESEKKLTVIKDLDEERKRHRLDVIVLDAGHGGKDPGTIGISKTKEKDIALAIVLKLGALIKKNLKDVKVVYTRDDDTFIELDKRGKIANEANGKLFISVHCNSMPRKPHPKRGFEVYLLRPGRTDEAIAIAERENSVIQLEEGYEQRYQKLTDDNFILVTMAQSAHMKASELFADFTTKELDKRLDTKNNGVAQAGFLVLVGSAMPNVLIETAYLSNRDDEKILRSEAGQQKYAEGIFNAIKKYKIEHEKLLQEGKDVGER